MVSRAERGLFARWWWTVDKLMLVALAALMLGGIVLSLAASPPVAARLGLDPFHFVNRHVLFLIPAFGVLILTSFLTPRQIRRLAFVVFLRRDLPRVTSLVVVLGGAGGRTGKRVKRFLNEAELPVEQAWFHSRSLLSDADCRDLYTAEFSARLCTRERGATSIAVGASASRGSGTRGRCGSAGAGSDPAGWRSAATPACRASSGGN